MNGKNLDRTFQKYCKNCNTTFTSQKAGTIYCDYCAKLKKCSCCGSRHEYLTALNRKYICDSCYKVKVKETHHVFNETNRDEWVECACCGVRMKDISIHITSVHKLSVDQYKEKYNLPVKSHEFTLRALGENNPGYQHGGKLSPWSKKSAHYNEESHKKAIKTAQENPNSAIHTVKIEYFLNQGMSEEQAKIALSERQSTFSLDKCIEKYGPIFGPIYWQERQDKWLATLNAKTDDEKAEINKKKIYRGGIVSAIETELLLLLKETLPVESQVFIKNKNKHYSFDIVLGKKIIEFNGIFWHASPKKYSENDILFREKKAHEIWENDYNKYKCAHENGYDVMYVWEDEYKKNKEEVIKKCIEFLTQ